MTRNIDPRAGEPAPADALVDLAALRAAYFDRRPDPDVASERVRFGTSGHRGSSLDGSFNEWHVLAITQAICDFRRAHGIGGPLYIGADTHALSAPALESALQVLAANEVTTMISAGGEFTPTPAVSYAIVSYNREGPVSAADGIVVTPSHNPPEDGGFKYNPPDGGPASTNTTAWIERQANAYLNAGLEGVQRVGSAAARAADSTIQHDYLDAYVRALAHVVNFDLIRSARIRMAVDPLGGAGVHYWARIAEQYRIDLSVVSEEVDPRFAFMTLDWDGRIRMDPSSPWAMKRLIALRDRYDVVVACDTDHDRHGVVAASCGLMPPNHYLSVLADGLFRQRVQWPAAAGIGKTVVTTSMIDRIARDLDRTLHEVPVGFKWFVPGLLGQSLGFACEESAGASLLRRDGTPWTTDKDGIVPALLAGELMAMSGRDPGERYVALEQRFGSIASDRHDAPAGAAQRKALASLDASRLDLKELAGDPVLSLIDRAPGNDEPIGGIKAVTRNGWFAARPSGTEDIYKIYAESFQSEAHLQALFEQAQHLVDHALAGVPSR